MTPDWILVVGTLLFALTTWATLNFGYARFRSFDEGREPAPGTAPATERMTREMVAAAGGTGTPPDAATAESAPTR